MRVFQVALLLVMVNSSNVRSHNPDHVLTLQCVTLYKKSAFFHFCLSVSDDPVCIKAMEIHRWYKLFGEKFVLKFNQRQTQLYNPDFGLFLAIFSIDMNHFSLFGSNFTSFYIERKKIFRFELIKWKFFDFKFGRFNCLYEKLFLGK